MLLEFKTKNFKSFTDEMCFSMIPAPKQKGLDYSVLSAKCGSKHYKALCSAVIYGPNASGKSNLIGAMDAFKAIVLRGNIRNADVFSINASASNLELIPNCNGIVAPTEFSIRYIDNGLLIEYSVTIDLGPFMEKAYERKILQEKLAVNGKQIFLRDETLDVTLPRVIKEYVNKGVKQKTPKMLEYAKGSLVDTELFLNNGFKSIYAQELVTKILDWFREKFIVICRAETLRIVRKFAESKENKIYVERTLTDAAKIFGVTKNPLGFRKTSEKEPDESELYSIIKDKILPAEIFESYGTIRFVNQFPLVINALINGGTLIVDEFDASIHPMALMNIITIFHNDDLNKNNAQLIFNTHNTIFLDASLLRRDEIKFVERDDETGNSTHYSLSDFKTADGIRKGEDYMNNYFVSRYGAIKDIDFSPILEKIVAASEVASDG